MSMLTLSPPIHISIFLRGLNIQRSPSFRHKLSQKW